MRLVRVPLSVSPALWRRHGSSSTSSGQPPSSAPAPGDVAATSAPPSAAAAVDASGGPTAAPPSAALSGKASFLRALERMSKSQSNETPGESTGNHGIGDAAAAAPPSTAAPGVQPAPRPNSAFLSALSQVESGNASKTQAGKRGGAFMDRASERRASGIIDERKKMLIFRDVGMELDRAVLSRDLLLVPKYFYFGTQFAIDNELERMLRYFNEHAVAELKLTQDGKLMRGSDVLHKKGVLMPPLQQVTPLDRLISTRGSDPSPSPPQAQTQNPSPLPSLEHVKGAVYGKPELQMTVGSSYFRKPTLLIISQLGQRVGGVADDAWRQVALEYTDPAFSRALRSGTPESPADGSETSTAKLDEPSSSTGDVRRAPLGQNRSKPLDVLSCRCMDVHTYGWVQRLYTKRFVSSLVDNTYYMGARAPLLPRKAARNAAAAVTSPPPPQPSPELRAAYHEWIVRTTCLGSGVVRSLYHALGLWNHLCPYALLIDHQGRVRWMSSGSPDVGEKAVLPKLIQQLDIEYFRDGSGGGGRPQPPRTSSANNGRR